MPKSEITPLTGGCLCGKVRYLLLRRPRELLDCHCVDCRRSSGAPYVSWGTVDRRHFEVTRGRLKRVVFAGRIRSFAPCCGTQILFESSRRAPEVDVTLGSLDEPSAFAPRRATWCEDHVPWVPLNARRPAFVQRSGGRRIRIAK